MVDSFSVDAAAVIRRLFILPGEVSWFIQAKEKSAEAIVAASHEPVPKGTTQEVSLGVKGRTLSRSQYSMDPPRAEAMQEAEQGTNKEGNEMIEQVINRRNTHLAYGQVLRNQGSAGVDGMAVSELKPHLRKK